MTKLRGQAFEAGIITLIGVVIFVLIAYALLPTVANSQAFATQQSTGVQANYTTFAAPLTAVNNLTPVVLGAAILLAILSAGIGVYSLFSR